MTSIGPKMCENINWLVVSTPLKNMSSSVGMMTFPKYGKIKNVPNHQPVKHMIRLWFCLVFPESRYSVANEAPF